MTAWRQDPARLHSFTLEAIEEAEHVGTPRRGFRLPARAPPVFAGVLAPLHHAAEIAEQAAMVDLISADASNSGWAPDSGYRVPEYELFGAEFAADRWAISGATARSDVGRPISVALFSTR
ncbi:MAG: hypothetical protein QOE41_4201 [Mycobacterium sp.]|nr:hypothetical protein [Mycobacterium sp.]